MKSKGAMLLTANKVDVTAASELGEASRHLVFGILFAPDAHSAGRNASPSRVICNNGQNEAYAECISLRPEVTPCAGGVSRTAFSS